MKRKELIKTFISLCKIVFHNETFTFHLGYIMRSRALWFVIVKVIYHPLYGMNNYILIWGD